MAEYPQFCALARAAEIVGERWSLLILRELMLGPRRFTDLRRRLQPITPSVLSQRLQSLGDADLIERVEIHHPIPGQVFKLTATGEAFRPNGPPRGAPSWLPSQPRLLRSGKEPVKLATLRT
jgi:DNA-binding HxlR family transcriptional regulator